MSDYKAPDHGNRYNDVELNLTNRSYYLDFFHVPSGRSVKFKGMITEFSDDYASNWNETIVYGRSDPILTFQSTKRVISLGWDVVAASVGEAKENLEKASLLFSMLYPTYAGGNGSNASTIVASPLFKLSFANLIQNVGAQSNSPTGGQTAQQELVNKTTDNPSKQVEGNSAVSTENVNSGLVGKVDGFKYKPEFNAGFFDVADGILYPQTIKLTCNYTVVHTHELGWGTDKNPRKGFATFPYGVNKPIDSTSDVKTSNKSGGTEEQKKANALKMIFPSLKNRLGG